MIIRFHSLLFVLICLFARWCLAADCEIECPSPDHPGVAIVTCPVPAECEHKSGDCKAVVYDYTTKPPAGEKPTTKHYLKSKSPCGCVVVCVVCKCIPNTPADASGKPIWDKGYTGKCVASYVTKEAEKKGIFDASVCTYEITCTKEAK